MKIFKRRFFSVFSSIPLMLNKQITLEMKQNKHYYFVILALLFLFCFSSITFGQGPDSLTYKKIDDYIQKQMEAYKIPGASVGIIQGNRKVYLKGYGTADNTGRKVTPQTPFLLASVTKSFTALCIMQLVEEGKINLDESVQKYIPWFHTADTGASSQITVRHLLNQTSGFSTLDGNKPFSNTDMRNSSLETYVRSLTNVKLIAAPGQKFEYSNINYGILGLIIQKISEQSYESYVQNKILAPLDMQHSFTSQKDARANNAAIGHYPFFGFPVVDDKTLPAAAASWSGIYSSAEDMTHYLIAQINGGRYGNYSILSANGINEMHKPAAKANAVKDYAMGWFVGPYYDIIDTAIRHDGEGPAFHSFALLVPGKHFGVVWLMNIDYPPTFSVFSSMGFGIAEIYMGIKPPSPPIYEDFIEQNIRIILTIIIILLGIGVFRSTKNLRRWRGPDYTGTHRNNRLWRYIMMPAAIDILLTVYLMAVLLPGNAVTIPITLYFTPDVGLLLILILLLTIGWGLIRTILMLRALYKKPTVV
ncbi:MAG TPA: serine hydrolase domain-containing protein [Cyclobacteriaceae bacterium]|nr:serine hydrolase domain-containing protein [Cyclobacteriaceae bacterium]